MLIFSNYMRDRDKIDKEIDRQIKKKRYQGKQRQLRLRAPELTIDDRGSDWIRVAYKKVVKGDLQKLYDISDAKL